MITLNTLNDHELLVANRNFYEPLWRDTQLVEPERFNTWPLISPLVARSTRRLEVAPGLRPRLPFDGTTFVDISMNALTKLTARGGRSMMASIGRLPFADGSFDLLCALDIIEHVDDDQNMVSQGRQHTCTVASGKLSLFIPVRVSRALRWATS